jgi:glycosyltransferase involved in cell wall biosynthesis
MSQALPGTAPVKPLRVLIVHNAYRLRGGEDAVVDAEEDLLRQHGHIVHRYQRHNDEINTGSGLARIRLLRDTLWSGQTTRDMASLLASFKPDVMHVHNTLSLVSPSVYWAAHRAGVPVVQTLHNFRLLCPQAMLLRDGQPCRQCVGHVPWRAIQHSCYRDSATQSAAVAVMLQLHRTLGTWSQRIQRYIVPSEFCREIFEQSHLPIGSIQVKPNFVVDRHADSPQQPTRHGLLYVGRLTTEKGVNVLHQAWLKAGQPHLTVIGQGPASTTLTPGHSLELRGAIQPDEVAKAMAQATALVVPSLAPETFGLVVIEAFAAGLPVIASQVGALTELIDDGETGFLVPPDDAQALADKMGWANANPQALAAMGRKARAAYLARFTPQANLGMLESIYQEAITASCPT